jgi:hypothetical protein
MLHDWIRSPSRSFRNDLHVQVRGTTYLLSCLSLIAIPQPVRNADTPNCTVGPQNDCSIVASDNQTLTPAGRIVQLGSPACAKTIALSPHSKTSSGAVLLMGSPHPIIVFNTATGQVLLRLIPIAVNGTSFTSDKAASFTGITYSAEGSKLFLRTITISSSRMWARPPAI